MWDRAVVPAAIPAPAKVRAEQRPSSPALLPHAGEGRSRWELAKVEEISKSSLLRGLPIIGITIPVVICRLIVVIATPVRPVVRIPGSIVAVTDHA